MRRAEPIHSLRKRGWTAALILLIVPIGFGSKFYSGPAHDWVNNNCAGAFYDVFWCLVFCFLFVNSRPWVIAACVLVGTCILEFTQMWNPPFLEYLRGNSIGATILGTDFDWFDFPYYFIGSAIGWLCLTWLKRVSTSRTGNASL